MTCSSDLIKWYNENKLKELSFTVGKLNITTIIELIETYLNGTNHEDGLSLLKGIFLGCEKDPVKRGLALSGAFKEVIRILGNASSKDKHHNDLICVLNHEVGNLSPESLVEISSIMVEMIRNNKIGQGQPLKILSKLLETAQQHTSLTLEKTSEVVCGSEYKKFIVEELCSITWKSSTTFPLIEMFKDLLLTAEETKVVINKCLDQLPCMNEQTLPPMIYQLIALATTCNKLDPVIKGIILHFNKLDSLAPQVEDSLNTEILDTETAESTCDIADLKSMEGTVLLYFSNTLRQNHDLGKVIMKLLKTTRESASPESVSEFFLALALTLTQDSRFQEDALSGLRLLVLKCFQDTHKTNERKWLKSHRQQLTDIKKVMLNVVKNCSYGWDHVISGVVDLAYSLMTSYGPKQGPFKKTFDPEHQKTSSPQQSACDLGSHLLARTFKLHQISRKEIVSQVINRILISGNSPAYLYIDLLKAIIKSYPQLLLQTVPQVKNMLDDLPLMHEYNAKKLLSALLPLLKISAPLRDGLMLTLRKSLSSRQRESRHTAVHGFLMILKSFPLSEMTSLSQISSQSSQSIFSTASTQTQADVHSQGASPPRSNELLCLEILQVLKRCLKQQATVRCQLYAGLAEVVKRNPRLAPFVLNSLVKQLRLYYEAITDVIPPLNLTNCLSTSQDSCVVQEPLPVLITVIYTCLREARDRQEALGGDDEIIDDVTDESVREMLDSLTMRMCKTDLDDYQLEKSSEYGNSTKMGRKNAAVLALFMGVYQSLIDYNFTCCELTDDSVHRVLQLHQCYQKAADFMQSLKNPDLGGKNWLEAQLACVSAPNLCHRAHTLFGDESMDNESAVEALTSNESFLKYTMNLAHEMLMSAKEISRFPGVGCHTKADTYSCVSKLARACLHKFLVEKNEPTRCPVTLHCLQCFHASLQYVTTWYKSKVATFFAEVCGEDADWTQGGDKVTKLIKRFQRIVMSFLASENQPLSVLHRKVLSELFALMETLFQVAFDLDHQETLDQCTEWFYKLCVEYKVEEPGAAKRLLHSHLRSALLTTAYPETCFRDLCFDVRLELGTVADAESSERSTPAYQLVTQDNAHHVLVAIATHAENLIADCEWLLHHLKGRLVAHASGKDELADDDDSLHEARRKAEGSVCGRVCTMAVGMLELAQCACQSAANVDNVLRTFITVFTFLTNLSKYYQWLYGQGLGHVPSRFEKLSNFVGSELMRPIYGFITYAENAQTERLETVKAKHDAKKGKKKTKTTTASVSATGKAKVLREMKGIAKLVYAIEQHEHHLILLGRKAKIDFMRSHHLTTSRDFRIRSDVLRLSLAEQEADKETSRDGEDDNEEEGENEDDGEPSSKRVRVGS